MNHSILNFTMQKNSIAPAGDWIVRKAEEVKADLIVCGTHGRRGIPRLVMGSDAEQVVRRAPVPVLLVREKKSQSLV